MVVYILRHGTAVARGSGVYPNDDRPLTENGKRKMAMSAGGIAKVAGEVDVILTSPLIRAQETARIAARALGIKEKVEICKELLPGTSLKQTLVHLARYKRRKKIMLVGHEPELGHLASALMGSHKTIVEFKKGALCAIEVSLLLPRRSGKLLWHLQSKHLRALSP
jgi:phosphohistidine phosphatase